MFRVRPARSGVALRVAGVVSGVVGLVLGAVPVHAAPDPGNVVRGPAVAVGGPGRDRPAVQWDRGGGPRQMARGLPSPPGWYEAAFGTRTRSKVLYLTFDDGPVPGRTDGLLRLLDRYDATATFFLVGYRAAANPGLVRRIAREGHAIGNHTYTHPRLTDLSSEKVAGELRRTTRVLGSAQGGCMRPPFGLINSTVARMALGQGLQPIMWTNHIEDWRTHSVAWHTARLRAATKPGAVILAHDTNPRTIKAVARMLPEWKRAGYQLKAIPACRTT